MTKEDALKAADSVCNTDCSRYRKGTCPYNYPHTDCPRIQQYVQAAQDSNTGNISNTDNNSNTVNMEKLQGQIEDALRAYLLDNDRDVLNAIYDGIDSSGIVPVMARYITRRIKL